MRTMAKIAYSEKFGGMRQVDVNTARSIYQNHKTVVIVPNKLCPDAIERSVTFINHDKDGYIYEDVVKAPFRISHKILRFMEEPEIRFDVHCARVLAAAAVAKLGTYLQYFVPRKDYDAWEAQVNA